MAQKFAHVDSLRDLHVLDGVQMMFQNLGWNNLLNINAPSYNRPPREILSSLTFADLIGQDLSDTFDPFNTRLDATFLSRGWHSITNLDKFKASSAKASSIVHPVLKTAHRILASVVFRERSWVPSLPLNYSFFCVW